MSRSHADIIVVGWPDAPGHVPSAVVRERIAHSRHFVGTGRLHERVSHLLPSGHRWETFGPGCSLSASGAGPGEEPVLVVASGDPLFYGIAGTLRARFPRARIEVHPWFSSLQVLCHRAGIAHGGMRAVSVHGRDWADLDEALIRGERLIGVLTDAEHAPARIARRLLDHGYSHYRAWVGERLESPEERVREASLEALVSAAHEEPNCVLLWSDCACPAQHGIDDARFQGLEGRPDMITKMPVRLASLARLELGRRACLWDIGFCTGAMSIEARLLHPHLRVHAIERRSEGLGLIEANARRLGAPGIHAVAGDFLSTDLVSWQRPDAVFVGGHGGRLHEVLRRIDTVLLPGGRVVLNAVREQSRVAFDAATRSLGYETQPALRLQVDAHNPIEILVADKPRQHCL